MAYIKTINRLRVYYNAVTHRHEVRCPEKQIANPKEYRVIWEGVGYLEAVRFAEATTEWAKPRGRKPGSAPYPKTRRKLYPTL